MHGLYVDRNTTMVIIFNLKLCIDEIIKAIQKLISNKTNTFLFDKSITSVPGYPPQTGFDQTQLLDYIEKPVWERIKY